ncbi:MAG: type III pantothenate kinase [Pirellulaceae bacterium]|jgi:type III pantothenate kinase
MTRPLIAVDIGNTSIQLGVFPQPQSSLEPSLIVAIDDSTSDSLESLLPAEPCDWFVASVNREREAWLSHWQTSHRGDDLYRNFGYRDYPGEIDVLYPDKVGADRLVAAAAAAKFKASNNDAIVVDSGTAITVDNVAANGTFRGGAILPGRHLTVQALFHGTDQLPAIQIGQVPPAVVGRCTESAIQAGVYWGTVGAVNLLVQKMLAQQNDTHTEILVTGRDGERLATHLPHPAKHFEHLVLQGIVICSGINEQSSP